MDKTMTPTEERTVGSIDSETMIDDEGAEERLRKELRTTSDERDSLRDELQSAKDEIARLQKELLAANSANAGFCEKVGPKDGAATSDGAEGPSVENEDGEGEDQAEEHDVDSEESSSQGTESSEEEEDAVPPSTDDDIRLRAARTLIWADSAIKRNTPRSSTRSIGSADSPAGVVPATVQVVQSNHLVNSPPATAGGLSTSSCGSTGSQSSLGRPSRDGYDNESLLSIPESEDDSTPRKAGPFAGVRQFLEESMEDRAPNKPPASSYKYCNEAFKKLNEKKGTNSRAAESKVSAVSGGETAKPYCNEAFLKLNQKKSAGTFSMSKLFN